MGDGADDALDRMMDIDEIYVNNRDLDPNELHESHRELIYGYDGTYNPGPFDGNRWISEVKAASHRNQKSIKCKYCGETGLLWTEVGTNVGSMWRLSKDGIIHSCKEYKK